MRVAGHRWTVAVTATVLLAGLTWLVLRGHAMTLFDRSLSQQARWFGLAHPGWIAGMRLVTHAGDGVVMLAVVVLLGVVLVVRRRFRDLVVLVAGCVAARELLVAMQWAVGRSRPVGGFVYVGLPSFPSGHTVQSGTVALLAVLVLRRGLPRAARFAVAAGAVAWTVVVGLSRIALLAHWPSDVAAGWLLVILVVAATAGVVDGLAGLAGVPRAVAATRVVTAIGDSDSSLTNLSLGSDCQDGVAGSSGTVR